MSSKKEVAKSAKTLIIMLQSLRNHQVTIHLRNDTIVCGTILKVDSCMNIELENATVEDDQFYCCPTDNVQTGSSMKTDEEIDIERNTDHDEDLEDIVDGLDEMQPEDERSSISSTHEYFFVKGSRIRHIDLPTDLDLVASAKGELERIRNRGRQWTKRDIIRSSE